MADKKYLDYAGLKRVLAKLLPGARKIWHGTIDEWDALSAAEKDKYDQAEIVINAVNKIELNNKNLIQNKAVYNRHAEIGWQYQSSQFRITANGWTKNLQYTFQNLPKGSYLISGLVGTDAALSGGNALGIIYCHESWGQAGFQIPTSDWYAQSATLGLIKHNGGNYTIHVDMYKQRVTSIYGYIYLLKIA